MSIKGKKPVDPSDALNAKVLAEIKQREEQKIAEAALAGDIGLDPKPRESNAATAAEFLSDEFDRRVFGDPVPTYTRTVYGPDPLLKSCPQMKQSIESIGLEDYARATAEAILLKEDRAVPDPVLQRHLRTAIHKFGKASVAEAFRERILKIPSRTVEIEADREDPMLFSRPLEEAVERYGTPGMAAKFLSERCNAQFGTRGYQIVKDEHGDPVRVGTLIMGEIPERMAERRRQYYANESNSRLASMEDSFRYSAERGIRDNGGEGAFSVLKPGETVRSQAAGDFSDDPMLTASYLNRTRETGFHVKREG